MIQHKGQESKGEKRSRLLKQFGFAILGTIGHFSLGTSLTWPSPALSDLALNNNTLVGTELVLTPAQMDMTGSLMALGCLLGSWISGSLVTRFGRRGSMQIVVVPWLIGFAALAFAPNVFILLAARLMLGLASGVSSVAGNLYVTEIADAEIRGAMCSIPNVAIVLGGLFVVGVGCLVRWYYLALLCAGFPLILLIGTFFLPNSPSLLVVHGKKLEAMRVLRKLRGPYVNLGTEIEIIERKNSTSKEGWRKHLNWHVVKHVIIVVTTFAFQHLCGNYVYVVHTARLLRRAGTILDADISTVIVAAARLLGMMVSFYCLDRIGRRTSLVVSYTITSTSLFVIGSFIYMAEAAPSDDTTFARLSWVPLVCLIMVVFSISVGAQPVPYLLAAEYFPTNIRGHIFPVCYSSGMLFSFLVLQLYSPMVAALTQPGLYWFYATVSCLAVVFTLIFVKETKGENIG